MDSWPIFPQNLSLLCLGNLGLIAQFRGFFVCTVFFGCVMDALLVEAVVVVVEHEMEKKDNI